MRRFRRTGTVGSLDAIVIPLREPLFPLNRWITVDPAKAIDAKIDARDPAPCPMLVTHALVGAGSQSACKLSPGRVGAVELTGVSALRLPARHGSSLSGGGGSSRRPKPSRPVRSSFQSMEGHRELEVAMKHTARVRVA